MLGTLPPHVGDDAEVPSSWIQMAISGHLWNKLTDGKFHSAFQKIATCF